MAKARKTLSHLKAVRNVRSVTGVMAMVATSRFRKTHEQLVAARPYGNRLMSLTSDIIRRGESRLHRHPLLHEPKTRREALLVITSNRGLCGGYNNTILDLGLHRYGQLVAADHEVALHVAGKKGIQFLRYRNFETAGEHTHFGDIPAYDDVAELAEQFMEQFLDGRIGGLEVVYMQFVSSGRQSPAVAQVLPLSHLDVSGQTESPEPVDTQEAEPLEYEFVPSTDEILDRLLPAATRLRVYQCFLDSAVGEQVARIRAMRAATENADEMIHGLTLEYNHLRQSQITNELAEIMGGREGLD